MKKNRTEEGFSHNPDAVPGVDVRVTTKADGNVTVTFGDGSEPLHMDRREFMRLSGVAAASAAMAGTACRAPVEKIVPYVDRPQEVRIGTPTYFASNCTACPAQCGTLVKTRGGRPIKLEGNPKHPVNRGALCARGQSSYMDLYDPSRARTPLEITAGKGQEVTWEKVDGAVEAVLKGGGGVRLLTGDPAGSARAALVADLGRAHPNFKAYSYSPVNFESIFDASRTSYGISALPHYHFDLADVIVSLGGDFLGVHISPVEFTKQFSSRRDPDQTMNKLVVFEGQMSVTGMNADERFPVRPSDLHLVAMALANVALAENKSGPLANVAAAQSAVAPFTPKAVADRTGIPEAEIVRIGKLLAEAPGKSLVVGGGLAGENGLALESAINLLNGALQNEGRTITRERGSLQFSGGLAQLAELKAELESGKVDLLIIDGANPVYSQPAGFKFEDALKKVKLVVATTDRVDETAAHASYLAPAGHALENWGDAQPIAGTHSVRQPAILPLYDTRALEDSLIKWFSAAQNGSSLARFLAAPEPAPGNRPGAGLPGDSGPWYRYLRDHWEKVIYRQAKSLAGFERFWEDSLRLGSFTVPQSGLDPNITFRLGGALNALPKAMPDKPAGGDDLGSKEITLMPVVALYDGRQANNGHLQELPDPVTKLVWGSFAAVSPATFKKHGLEQGQWLTISREGAEGKFQTIIQPGLHDDVIALPVGYGRTHAGVVGNEVGSNAFAFSVAAEGRQVFGGFTAEVKKGAVERLANTQGAQVIDLHRRPLFGSTTLAEYEEKPESGIHAHPPGTDLWLAHDYSELKWGMAIDMTKCTGCSACVTACLEENNVSVVGRAGILEGREMYWMRIDRYYELPHEAAELQHSVFGDPMYAEEPVVSFGDHLANPRVHNQPLMCQHCENAGCETVCPVSATMHSSDGLNQMAYNRCVGTRYCANNCPFKVRRFNWYDYVTDRRGGFWSRIYPELDTHAELNVAEPLQLGLNPEVTVRSRGVMEKCTFCVQRIRRAKVQMRKEGRTKVRDGDVVPACQQTCPADAIVFGNLSDPDSAVAKHHAMKRASTALADLQVNSSVAYLTNVANAPAAHAAAEHGAEKADHG